MSRAKLLPIHPGEVLQEEFLGPLGISQYGVAKETSVSPRWNDEIIRGTRAITADTALRLSWYFGTSERFWLNLQVRDDLEIVSKHHSEHQIHSGLGRLRRGDRPPLYTVTETFQQLDIDPQWIDRGIAKGRIEISKDLRYGCYLFPRTKAAVARMKQLQFGKVHQLIFRKAHGDD